MKDTRLLLISVRPHYAEKLLSGEKTLELRRVRPALDKGDWVVIYASSPRKEIIGAFQVKETVVAKPVNLWESHGGRSAVPRDEFFAYFEGRNIGYGIAVDRVFRFAAPTSLEQIRRLSPTFHPPQGYAYLSSSTVSGGVLRGLFEQGLAPTEVGTLLT